MADVVSRVTRTVTPLIAAATFAIALACRSSEDAGSAATDARARLVSIPLATVGAPPIDVSFAAVPPTSTRHVAVAGSDTSTCGSSTSPCRSIEWAVALGGPGTEVQVHAGTWPIALSVFPGRAGNASAPRALRAAPGERVVLVPKETSPGTWKPPVDLETSYWTVDGFTIDCEDRAGLVGFYAVAADHVALRNSIVTRCPHSAVSIRFNSHHVLVEGNTLRENRSFDANDANGITVAYRSHDIVIRNNRLHQNSSDGFQCQGREQESDPTDLTLDPANILFANNEAHDNMEEAVDIKSCTNVTIAGNRLFGEDATTDAQNNRCGGAAIVGHFGARKLLIDSNRISNSGAGIVLGNVYLLVEDVVVKRNLIYGMNQNEVSTLSGRPQRNCGDGINLQRIRRADVYHNTIDSIPHAGVRIGANAYYRDPFAGGGTCAPFNGKIPCGVGQGAEGVRIWNNVISNVDAVTFDGLTGNGGVLETWVDNAPGLYADANQYAGSGIAPTFRVGMGTTPTFVQRDLAAWRAAAGQDAGSRTGDPLFVDYPEVYGYPLKAGSPALNAAILDDGNAANGERCGSGADAGARESDCPGGPSPVPAHEAGPLLSWTAQKGSTSTDSGTGVATDSARNVFISCYTTGGYGYARRAERMPAFRRWIGSAATSGRVSSGRPRMTMPGQWRPTTQATS